MSEYWDEIAREGTDGVKSGAQSVILSCSRQSLGSCSESSVSRSLSPDLQREGKHPAGNVSFINIPRLLIMPSFCVMYHVQLLNPYMMFTTIKILALMGDELELICTRSCRAAVGLSLYVNLQCCMSSKPQNLSPCANTSW